MNPCKYLVLSQDGNLYGYEREDILRCDIAAHHVTEPHEQIFVLIGKLPVTYAPIAESEIAEAKTELSAAEVSPTGEPLENVRLCPRCQIFDIDGKDAICASCEDEIAQENPDGRWVETPHGWIYE